MTKQSLKDARIVCAGLTPVAGGKLGELYALEADAIAAKDGAALRAAASAFAAGKRVPTTGAVYEATIDVEDGRIVSLAKERRYVAMLDTPAVQAAALASRGWAQREAAKKAEEKARKSLPGSRAIAELAAIVAVARFEDQEAIISAIALAIRKDARDVWKAGRK